MLSQMSGIYYFLHGFKLIFSPGIKRFLVIPLILNALVVLGLFLAARHFISIITHRLFNFLPHWLYWLDNVLWGLFILSFFFIFIYIYVTLANLISAPFNGLLAEKIALRLTGQPLSNSSLLSTVKDVPRILARQLSIIGYFIPRAAGIGLMSFVPIIQLLVAPLWFLFHAWFMSLQYIDYPTDNERIPLKIVKSQLRKKPLLNLTFGTGILLANMIPVLNLIAMPAAVAGATELWLREYSCAF